MGYRSAMQYLKNEVENLDDQGCPKIGDLVEPKHPNIPPLYLNICQEICIFLFFFQNIRSLHL